MIDNSKGSVAAVQQMERPADFNRDKSASKEQAEAKRWKAELERATKHNRKYLERADKIITRYRVENQQSKSRKNAHYNILWSIVSTLQPNLFMRMPRPYVSRRYNDKDPVARAASQILERALIYTNDSDEMHDAMQSAVDDYILVARGTLMTRYSAAMQLRQSEQKIRLKDGEKPPANARPGVDKDGPFYHETYEAVVGEECATDHVQIHSLVLPACSSWKQLPWIDIKSFLTREELVKRFGKEKGEKVPLLYTHDGTRVNSKSNDPAETDGLFLTACVHEIWDKVGRRVIWLCTDMDTLLDVKPDFLKLRNFFPMPRPLFGTTTNNTITPVPDFKYYEDIAAELDEVTYRISLLTEALRVVGIYDDALGETLAKIVNDTRENDLIPVSNYQTVKDGGGLKNLIEYLPIEQIAMVLEKLYKARDALVQTLYAITGISDIIRGQTDPNETASAQRIKGEYASKRLKRQQKKVARFAREHLEIHAEIICEHYSDETIRRISGAEQFLLTPDGAFNEELFQAAIALLRDEPLRHFRIKIDNDTLADEEIEQNREQATQFIQAITGLIQNAMPVAQGAPQLFRVMKEIILFGVRQFPIARSVETAIEEALDDLTKNPPPPEDKNKPAPKMSPEELELEKEKLRIERERLGLERQKMLIDERIKLKQLAVQEKQLAQDARSKAADTARTAATDLATLEHEAAENEKDRVVDLHKHRIDKTHDAVKHATQLEQKDRHVEGDREHQRQEAAEDRGFAERTENRRQELAEHQHAAQVAGGNLDRAAAADQHRDKIDAASKAAKAKASSAKKK